MKRKILLLCSVSLFVLSLIHLAFWKLFQWKEELPRLQPINQGIMQVLNIMVTFSLLFGAAISLRLYRRTHFERGERTLLNLYGGFFLLRTILEWPFFGLTGARNILVIVWCLALAAGFLWNGLERTTHSIK